MNERNEIDDNWQIINSFRVLSFLKMTDCLTEKQKIFQHFPRYSSSALNHSLIWLVNVMAMSSPPTISAQSQRGLPTIWSGQRDRTGAHTPHSHNMLFLFSISIHMRELHHILINYNFHFYVVKIENINMKIYAE